MFFNSWDSIGRIIVVGTLAYLALVLILRFSGKRTLAKLNAFDLVVTVALGSTLATVLLSKDVSLSEGVIALALLVFLQYVIAWMSVRSPRFQRLVKADPTLLMHQGRYLEGAMAAARVTREDLLSAIRAKGTANPEHVSVVLETDGTISVLAGDLDVRALDLQPPGSGRVAPS